MQYEPIPEYDASSTERLLRRADLTELRLAALAMSLQTEDFEAAEAVCLMLARHQDGVTRGNAGLALGHLAHIHRRLTESVVRPIVVAALRDPDV